MPANIGEAIRWCGFSAINQTWRALPRHSRVPRVSVLMQCCRYHRGAAAGMLSSKDALNAIFESGVDYNCDGNSDADDAKTTKHSVSHSKTAATSSSPSPSSSTAAALAEQECAQARAEGLHSSIHRAIAVTRSFSKHKISHKQIPLQTCASAALIVEGCRVRVKVSEGEH